jgi:4-hydroxybenzoate polyprenyltransferase
MKPMLFPIIFKALRPHQWVKNLLVFAPILLAHEVSDPKKFLLLIIGFVCLCFTASGLYLINDIFDREADRRHPVKKTRPIASGSLKPQAAIVCSTVLVGGSLAGAFAFVTPLFAGLLLGYVLLTIGYSAILKRLLVIDVLVLSLFYTVRLIAGGAAVDVPVSPWLLAFSWFFFLSLAFVKRFVEVTLPAGEPAKPGTGRGYVPGDGTMLQIAGLASGFMSVLVFLLYVTSSDQVQALYHNPLWLWMVAPVFVYWLVRTWLLAQRNLMNSDPVVFALKDPPSWVAAGIVGLLLLLGAVA